ncbi:MAG: hypothetical protein LBD06_04355 [Candidatus Accumulibacter sp.]|nr:hypothetical protein [Accumulibacter sp.]
MSLRRFAPDENEEPSARVQRIEDRYLRRQRNRILGFSSITRREALMERGRPARKEKHEAGGTPALPPIASKPIVQLETAGHPFPLASVALNAEQWSAGVPPAKKKREAGGTPALPLLQNR